MRLSRFLIAGLFVFFFVFGIRSQVYAQAADVCPDAIGTAQKQVCNSCRQDTAFRTANEAQCKHWIDSWGMNNTPPEIKKVLDASGAGANGSMNATWFSNGVPVTNKQTGVTTYPTTGLPGMVIGISTLLLGGENTTHKTLGAIPASTNMMALAFTNMPSSVEYIADVANTIRNPLGAQTAYAQGLGFSSLAPVLGIWKLMRNVAYFFFVIVFLVIGFLIMFRQKIGSQAAVTVQQALPQLVISLLLVTFSYAIAGLMIDIMYLIIYLMIGVFSSSDVFAGGKVPGMGPIIDIAFRNNIITNMMGLIGNSVGSIAGAVGNIAVDTLGLKQDWVSGWVVQSASNIVVTLILAIFILVSVFRVFFALLQAYVSIFFAVIFSPIQLLIGAIPGQKTFGQWIGNLFDNLMVFPTVIFILLIAFYFANPESRVFANTTMNMLNSPTATQTASNNSFFKSLPLADVGVVQNAKAAGFAAPGLGSNQGDASKTYTALIALGAIGILPDVIKVAKGLRSGKLGVDVGSIGNNLSKGWKGGEIIPGFGLSKIPGLGSITQETAQEKALFGSRDFRRRQKEVLQINPNAIVERGGLLGVMSNKPLNTLRTRQAKTEQAHERHEQQTIPGSASETSAVGNAPGDQ